MGQGLTGEAAVCEAERLLKMAIRLLDDSGNSLAAAHVSHALELLALDEQGISVGSAATPAANDSFSPSWGNWSTATPTLGEAIGAAGP
ncbi:hypothetical protein GGQ88_002716 [Novosphingobium hassiacum]|uniref:Uncharacterized protein n=1 Tax=Novosphingobium hassiacum TaxID=173676 RepID=A0A7W5ZY85_9SPHN|nr:hypothetical protein [Novosphingobium hassiacum]MBB3861432.1 hypothetical protein [Novosphingobium hassiacum]